MIWVNKYIGQRWTQEKDCGYWFRLIQKEQFNRDVPIICNIPAMPEKFCRQAMHIMKKLKREVNRLGWTQVERPKEGDAAMLASRTHINHIGIVVLIDHQIHILHALEQCGIILSTISNLTFNGLRVDGYYTYGN